MEPSEGGCCVRAGEMLKKPEYLMRNNSASDISRRHAEQAERTTGTDKQANG
jgi:hypothetical protein